jgi:hypothetical protein
MVIYCLPSSPIGPPAKGRHCRWTNPFSRLQTLTVTVSFDICNIMFPLRYTPTSIIPLPHPSSSSHVPFPLVISIM